MTESDGLMSLIADAKAGDKLALDALLGKVRRRMKEFLLPRAGQTESSDVAQDGSIVLAASLSQFRGSSPAEFWSWVIAVARSTLTDEIRYRNRKKRNGQEIPLPEGSGGSVRLKSSDETPSEIAQKREQAEAARSALETLSSDERSVIQLRHFEGKAWREVAAAIKSTEAAVKKRFQRAMKRWSERMQFKDNDHG